MRRKLNISGDEIYRGALSLLTLGIAVFTGGETARIAPFAFGAILCICLGLLLLPGTRYVNLLFLQLCLLFIFCYDSFDTFIRFVWLLPLVVVALAVHLYRLRPRLMIGPSLLPLVAVALATVLGGIGLITPDEYFSPAALGFVLALGPGLVLVYLLMRNEARDESDERALLSDLFWWGITAMAAVLVYAVPELWETGKLPIIQWSNNVSTMLMIAMPAVAWRVKRYPFLVPLLLLMPVAMILSGSRAGLLFAPVEFFFCAVWLLVSEKRWRYRLIHVGWMLAVVLVLAIWVVPPLLQVLDASSALLRPISKDEARWKLILRAIEHFKENPMFGAGFGYQGDADIYNGKTGTINWYHVFPAQVLGGLGLLGTLAWGWQLVTRLLIAIRVRKQDTLVLLLCYGGLLLMSMVNPGEFCPVPYAFLAVYFCALAENRTFGTHERHWLMPCGRIRKKRAKKAPDEAASS